MKPTLNIILIFLLGLTACSPPADTEFENPTRALAQDELIVIWRFPHSAMLNYSEALDTTEAFAQELQAGMDPLFQQLIPQIFADAKNGKLTIREEEDISILDEQPIPDLPARMKEQFGGSWEKLDPFQGVFHITQRRKGSAKGFPADELELMIIGMDAEGQVPEKYLGSVLVNDLVKLGYTIETGDKSYDFLSYLEQVLPFAYPIHYKTLEMANGLRTLEEAFATKQMVLDGKWDEIEWLDGEPDLSENQ